MPSRLTRNTAQARQQAADVLDDLTAVLAHSGIALPSVGVDWLAGQRTGAFLIDLGAARPEVVAKLVTVLRAGLKARDSQLR